MLLSVYMPNAFHREGKSMVFFLFKVYTQKSVYSLGEIMQLV